jgi:uncharacterized membrane protein
MRTNNRNKRFNNDRNQRDYGFRSEPRAHNILPSPGILESYEEIAPGSVNKILEMAKLEQEHRHIWENKYLKSMAYTTRVGQLLGFALAIILIYSSMALSLEKNDLLASVIVFSGFAFLMIAALASANSRKHINRPKRQFDGGKD